MRYEGLSNRRNIASTIQHSSSLLSQRSREPSIFKVRESEKILIPIPLGAQKRQSSYCSINRQEKVDTSYLKSVRTTFDEEQ